MNREIVLAEGKAEQAHSGRTGTFSWLAIRNSNGEFLPLPHIAGQSGRLVWIPKTSEVADGTEKT